ncbi:hypothetical protein E2C01_059887 [Portunus trituberculatus]|uniref:Uncharacterized protein n=1 Tax=Portunus trituberculatus TaxID=210409 RepID=A0A5B7GZM8_PORTR|nr:hypothetical protein [Portunus trituberculatus]
MLRAVTSSCALRQAIVDLTITTKAADTWLVVQCRKRHNEVFSSSPKTVGEGKFSKNNVKLVPNVLLTGAGYDGYVRTVTSIDTKPMTKREY